MPKGLRGFQKGQKFTQEHRKNISISHIGIQANKIMGCGKRLALVMWDYISGLEDGKAGQNTVKTVGEKGKKELVENGIYNGQI